MDNKKDMTEFFNQGNLFRVTFAIRERALLFKKKHNTFLIDKRRDSFLRRSS